MAERAIELDPHYAGGYVAMSWVYFHQWLWQWSPDPSALERSAEMAQRAIALDDSEPGVHPTLGCAHLFHRRHEQAIAEMERAIALDPNFADAHIWMTLILNYAGRPEEAIGWGEKALRLNPRYPGWYLNLPGYGLRLDRAARGSTDNSEESPHPEPQSGYSYYPGLYL